MDSDAINILFLVACWLPKSEEGGAVPAPSSAGGELLGAAAAVPAAGLRFGAAAGPSLMDACNAFCLLALKFVINEDCSIMVLLFFFF